MSELITTVYTGTVKEEQEEEEEKIEAVGWHNVWCTPLITRYRLQPKQMWMGIAVESMNCHMNNHLNNYQNNDVNNDDW